MRVVFIDFDGVLNSSDFGQRTKQALSLLFAAPIIDPDAVAVLNHIIALSGAKVVISSSWRTRSRKWVDEGSVDEFYEWLNPAGFKGEIVGAIDDNLMMTMRYERGDVIRTWLNWHADVTSFAVLDDSTDLHSVTEAWVYIDPDHGLLLDHVPDVLRRLGCSDWMFKDR